MNIEVFLKSIEEKALPANLSPHLQALWYDGLGDWQSAHAIIDHLNDTASAHVHAYLHRKEGDIWNADYWYKRAGKARPSATLAQEWQQLLETYL
ncbi:hypothetical protein ACXZ1K_18490 [Pedobacter sp. PWIIR3]